MSAPGTDLATRTAGARRAQAPPRLEVVVPVHNEQLVLEASVRTLHARLMREFGPTFRITVAENASTDATGEVAQRLAGELAEVTALRLGAKGRGGALRAAWEASDADVLAYMDVDLSTDLSALRALIVPLLEARADIVIGSRLIPGAEVTRSLRRELISRAYNLLLRLTLGVGVADAQCGFKAARRELIQPLLAEVRDDGWFFDTELLYLASRGKLAIREIPVRWVEDSDSRVRLLATVLADVRGVRRLLAASRKHALHDAKPTASGAALPGRA